MKLKDQVTSLELSKKLKKLGIKQNAYWTWYTNGDDAHLLYNPEGCRGFENKSFDAFTLSEICDLIPGIVLIKNRGVCSASYGTLTNHFEWSGAETLIEAATNLLILLINEKEITP